MGILSDSYLMQHIGECQYEFVQNKSNGSVNSNWAHPPVHLSGIVQLCPPQGGAFVVTGQPDGYFREFYLYYVGILIMLNQVQLNLFSYVSGKSHKLVFLFILSL